MRPPLWTLVAIPILAALGWFLLMQPATPARQDTTQQEQHLLLCTASGKDCIHLESTPHYVISVTFPNTRGREQQVIEQALAQHVDQFKADLDVMLSAAEKARLEQAGRKYEFTIQYKPYSGSGYNSYEFDLYIDTGGAHPNSSFETLVFTAAGKEVQLADLFLPAQAGKPGSRYLDRLSAESYTQVRARLAERLGEVTPDMEETVRLGTSPSPETLQNFLIDGQTLVILIPPYQAAAYAAGSFAVRIPLSSLKDILR
ncbi:MAG: DUF3298 domain-containing protein [Patescibacteria group bacterium]